MKKVLIKYIVASVMTQSMSRVAKCIDNSPVEDFWGILKQERYYGNRFTDKETLVKKIENYIKYYNRCVGEWCIYKEMIYKKCILRGNVVE